jgi:Secretion system C-terminal sorting domain/HYR domain
MRKNLRQIYLVLLGTLISFGAFAQCPTVNCPANVSVGNDSALTTTIVNYTIPLGVDSCFADSILFTYTGTIEEWIVPAGVTNVNITVKGAEGSYNTSSAVGAGLGAIMIGDFIVIPGDTFDILVGQQYHATGGNGGGGGSFVVDKVNNPIIIAGGGGGSSESIDSPEKHGQIGTTGGTGAGGGGTGGTAGNGGNIGATFASGAGGGLLTDGADGWTVNTGGDAFVNGGAGATENVDAQGGFGGGGSGSSYVVGGGGGGYSGGGSGSNSTGAGVGGGGASYNDGTNQVNTVGANSGNGQIIVKWTMHTDTAVLVSGLGSGAAFPMGTTTETYRYYSASGDSADCSFTVTVVSTANIEETEEINSANVYPNPSNGSFMLEMNNTEENTIQIEIYDIAGKLILTNSVNDPYIKQQLNMEKEASGIYFLTLTSDKHTATYKLVKY